MIFLNVQTPTKKLNLKKISGYTKKIARLLKVSRQNISITFCDDRFIKTYNRKYRHKNKPTDVLSFESAAQSQLGDIIISWETAQKNCQRFGTTFFEEIIFLIVHGFCHLLGHDHELNIAAEKKMQNLEKRVLYQLFKKEFYV